MRRFHFVSLFLVLCLAAGAAGHEKSTRNIDRFSWLQGRWQNVRHDRITDEVWLAPIGGSMMGVGRVVKADSVVDFEVVFIREHGSRFAYEAHPSGQKPATFLSTIVTDSSIIFENLEHDFPRRIGYQRCGDDSLYAWVEGPSGGKTKRNEFPYRRAPQTR
jgi:hypothetical protein